MSKITNDGLTRSGTGCFIAAHMATVGVKGLNVSRIHWTDNKTYSLFVYVNCAYVLQLTWQYFHLFIFTLLYLRHSYFTRFSGICLFMYY